MRGQLLSRSIPLLLALLATGTTARGAEGSPHINRIDTRSNSVEPGAYYFGVIGQVERPGVYEFSTPFPPLAELIHHAGGLTETGTIPVRVIRRGLPGPNTVIEADDDSAASLESTLSLTPGDVVIVGEAGGVAPIDETSSAIDRHKPASAPEPWPFTLRPIALVFVNLIDRPVIETVRPEHGNLADVVRLLGQSQNVLSSIRVLEPGRAASATDRNFPPGQRLMPGTVLVFDAATIQSDRLPQFTEPIRLLRSGGGHNSAFPVTVATSDTIGNQSTVVDELPLQNDTSQRADTSVSGENPLSAEEIAKAKLPLALPASGTVPHPLSVTPTVSTSGRPASSQLAFVGFVLAFGAFVFFWMMSRRDAASCEVPIEESNENVLHELIHNELPVTEESVSLPANLRFFGRSLSSSPVRIDSAHREIMRPHFAAASNRDNSDDTTDRIAVLNGLMTTPKEQTRALRENRNRQQTSSSKTENETSELLDRVLLAIQGGGRS